MSEPYSNVGKVVRSLITGYQWYSAIKYVSPTKVIKATRRGRKEAGEHAEFVVSIGKPNYAERIFVKSALAAKEPFPIKKIQLV